jgi:hypothetical protein
VLHSNEDAATKILVPGLTVHDSTPPGANGATVPPRSRHANAEPPVPKGFWALGVSNTVVHSAPRVFSSFFAGAALVGGAATQNATAARNKIRARRDTAKLPGWRHERQ